MREIASIIMQRFSVTIRKLSLFVLLSISMAACQTPGSSTGGGAPGSPVPSIPGGGSSGSPSSSNEPAPPTPSQGSESGSESESSSTAESGGEGESSDNEPPPGWEDDTSIAEGEAGKQGEEGEVTFEESDANDGEVSFEEPVFDDNGGLTQEELEELERELNESLGDFDEDIAREKTYAEERANESVADEPLGGVGTFESYEGDDDARSGSSSSSQTASADASSSSSSENSSAQSSSDSSNNAGDVTGDNAIAGEEIEENSEDNADLPPDVPENIADDDIVARQIREAAENETDPELKEKLWAEYRRYKNQ